MSIYSRAWADFLTQPDKDVFRWFAHLWPGKLTGYPELDVEILKKAARRLIRRLSINCYGFKKDRAGNRRPKSWLPVISVIENRNREGKRVFPHLHIILGNHPKLKRWIIIKLWLKSCKSARTFMQQVDYLNKTRDRRKAIDYVLKYSGTGLECLPAFINLGTDLESRIVKNSTEEDVVYKNNPTYLPSGETWSDDREPYAC